MSNHYTKATIYRAEERAQACRAAAQFIKENWGTSQHIQADADRVQPLHEIVANLELLATDIELSVAEEASAGEIGRSASTMAQHLVQAVKARVLAPNRQSIEKNGGVYSHTFRGNQFYKMPDGSELALSCGAKSGRWTIIAMPGKSAPVTA